MKGLKKTKKDSEGVFIRYLNGEPEEALLDSFELDTEVARLVLT